MSGQLDNLYFAWFEEAATVSYDALVDVSDTCRGITDSAEKVILPPKLFYTWNPKEHIDPVDRLLIELKSYDDKDVVIQTHSIYDLPKDWQNPKGLKSAEAQKAVNEKIWKKKYLGLIEAGSSDYPFKNLPILDKERVGFDGRYAFLDPSFSSSEESDYTALSILYTSGDRDSRGLMNKIYDYDVEGYAFNKPWYQCIEDIATILKSYNIEYFGYEGNNGMSEYATVEFEKHGVNNAEHVWTSDKKINRLRAMTYLASNIRLISINQQDEYGEHTSLSYANSQYIEQITNWDESVTKKPAGRHDDAPDSLSCLFRELGVLLLATK